MSGLTTIAALPRAGGGVSAALVAERNDRPAVKVMRVGDTITIGTIRAGETITAEMLGRYISLAMSANPLLSLHGASNVP